MYVYSIFGPTNSDVAVIQIWSGESCVDGEMLQAGYLQEGGGGGLTCRHIAHALYHVENKPGPSVTLKRGRLFNEDTAVHT